MRILLVEDDPDLAAVLALGLRAAAYATDDAASCREAELHLVETSYDVVCLDLGLPDGDGLDLLRELGSSLRRPRRLLVLTARDGVEDRVAGLDGGADDYLVKPVELAELLARLRALTRREGTHGTVLRVGEVAMDLGTQRATRAGRDLPLTARETALLHYSLHHPAQELSSEHLLEHVWDAHADPFTTTVRVILARVRRKLGDPPVIETVTGAGYRLRLGQ